MHVFIGRGDCMRPSYGNGCRNLCSKHGGITHECVGHPAAPTCLILGLQLPCKAPAGVCAFCVARFHRLYVVGFVCSGCAHRLKIHEPFAIGDNGLTHNGPRLLRCWAHCCIGCTESIVLQNQTAVEVLGVCCHYPARLCGLRRPLRLRLFSSAVIGPPRLIESVSTVSSTRCLYTC